MIIHWRSIGSRIKDVYTQPRPDVLRINDVYEVDFSDTEIVEYDIPEQVTEWISKAVRIDGILHLTLLNRLSGADKGVIAQAEIPATDIGKSEAVTWKK